ncbi:MAG: T9SS type A sorting domain-containing protein, partial [Candidatus Cloacimonetes bacterium]|nr:T9SS type A sorting domain-containing protein [Candidatus Cloacimonadota bacterium]
IVPNTDIIVIKLDVTGDTLWTYRKDGSGDSDSGNWIIENSENNLLVMGKIRMPSTYGYLNLLNLDGSIIWEEIVGDNNIWYEHFYAIDLPECNSFLLSTAYRVYKCDYYYNIEWISGNLLPWFQKINNEYIFYIGGIDGVHLRKTDNSVVEIDDSCITSIQKLYCYPNPFNPEVTISFTASEFIENAFINIYNAKGQRVRELRIMGKELGTNSVVWDGCDDRGIRMASGIYFVTLNLNGKTLDFKKITMIK